MAQQLEKLEEYIGYRFHNRDHLRRALTCQSAINERHSQATDLSFQALEFVGDAALKYAVATLLYVQQAGQLSQGQMHDGVLPHISNNNLSRIGRAMNLDTYIVKGNGVLDSTDKMLADAVEAVLGAIVIDQQQQSGAENILLDVVARHWKIEQAGRAIVYPPLKRDDDKCCCLCCCRGQFCKWFFIICLLLIVLFAMIAYFFNLIDADL